MKKVFAIILMTVMSLTAIGKTNQATLEAYLFVYFSNNSPEGEQLRYAVSFDGFNYTPLNNGERVWAAEGKTRSCCIRDPHILRCEDGKTFYMVMTDMKCSNGWESNDGIVMMKSKDLVNWTSTAVDFPTEFPKLFNRDSLTHVWAPQTIYDRKAKKYMVYYSLKYCKEKELTIYYSYADKNFRHLTKPQLLADFGDVVLDADIIPTDTAYHMFLSGIDKATAPTLKGPWTKENRRRHIQPHEYVAEGPGAFKLNNSDKWCLMYDCFRNYHYQFCTSSDLENFKLTAMTATTGDFTPRHGTVMGITMAELERLLKAFPSDGLTVESLRSTAMPEGCRSYIANSNPIFKHEYTADPAPVVYGDKLWLFCGHDVPGKRNYNIPEWSLFSTTDLTHWQQYPSPLKIGDITWDRSKQAYAAHAVEKDGKYYFYFSTNGSGIGVAVADRPEGPYKDALGKPLLTNADCPWASHGWRCIDPAVFIDDDGTPWLFWGNVVPYYAKLKQNMIELDSEVKRVDLRIRGMKYTEAPWVHKHNGKYYFTFAVGFPEKLAYAVSDKIDGRYETKGLLAEVAGNSTTTHPGIVKFKGEWYLFTHDGSLEGGSGNTRSVCVYKLKHNDDGTIEKVNLDSRGIW